jgi:hypothetical protein
MRLVVKALILITLVLGVTSCARFFRPPINLDDALNEELRDRGIAPMALVSISDTMTAALFDNAKDVGCLIVSVSEDGWGSTLASKNRLVTDVSHDKGFVVHVWSSFHDIYCVVIQDDELLRNTTRVQVRTHDDHVLTAQVDQYIMILSRQTPITKSEHNGIRFFDKDNNVLFEIPVNTP